MKLVLEAAAFAAKKHTHQRRKNIEDTPYINHPIEAASLLASAGITDEEILAAALLHDTIEDTHTTPAELSGTFGPTVLKYVLEVSDDKTKIRDERKRLQVEHAPSLSYGATLIKMGDRISNLRSVVNEPPKGWSVDRQLDYFEWSMKVFNALQKKNEVLEALFLKEYTEGLQHVRQRKETEHTFGYRMAGLRRYLRARMMRLTRYGPP
jgi:guanosine-3',5'-bis(diphosphate) 3'-pyrophosphohydrolase